MLTYSQLAPNQNNKASSLTNVFRNWGGSFDIACVTTMAERRQYYHQSVVGSNLTASTSGLQDGIRNTARYLGTNGYSPADFVHAATLHYYNQLGEQTHMLGCMDCFHMVGDLHPGRRAPYLANEKLQNGGRQAARKGIEAWNPEVSAIEQ